jgi:hypothetical protein
LFYTYDAKSRAVAASPAGAGGRLSSLEGDGGRGEDAMIDRDQTPFAPLIGGIAGLIAATWAYWPPRSPRSGFVKIIVSRSAASGHGFHCGRRPAALLFPQPDWSDNE